MQDIHIQMKSNVHLSEENSKAKIIYMEILWDREKP